MGPPLLITSEEFTALRPEWERLHAGSPSASPFTHPAFHAAWLGAFGQAAAPLFLSFRRDDELVGVAALDMERGRARTLGDPNVRDYGGPLALPGEEAAVASGLLEWLREDMTATLDLWGMPADAAMTEAFLAGAESEGFSVVAESEASCPDAVLPATFEEYVTGLSKHDRHELRRKLRHLHAAGAVRYESTGDPGEVATRFDGFLSLMRRSRDDKDEFLTPAMEAFFRSLASGLAAAGLARLGTLSLDGRPAASLFILENGETDFLYNSGYEPDLSALAVGLLSKALAIGDAVARSKRRFDFLRGDEDYKRRLGGQPHAVVTLRLRGHF